MSPIDVGGALPPPPPPPRDEDRDRTDRDRDRDRDDRANRFLKTVHESAAKGREQLAQHDAAVKKQADHDASERDVVTERSDRERTDSRQEGDSIADSKVANDRAPKRDAKDGPAREARRAANDATAANADLRRNVAGRTAPRADVPAPSLSSGARPQETTQEQQDGKRQKLAASRGAGEKGSAENAPASKPNQSGPDAATAAAPTAGNAPEAKLGKPGEEPVIPRGIVRQAVEFASFAERGGVIEFSLSLGNGGPSLALSSLGDKKIQIRVDHRGVKTDSGRVITRADLDELVARLKARGIDVVEVVLC